MSMSEEKMQHGQIAFERFRKFAQKVISVPKSEIDGRAKEYKKARKKRSKMWLYSDLRSRT